MTSPSIGARIGVVRPLVKTIATIVVLIGISSANDLADVRGGAKAMSCCAKARRSCAGLRTPDQCCKKMHPAPAHETFATAAGQRAVPVAMVAALPSTSYLRSFPSSIPVRLTGVKRPHDPPHLHTFSLLV